MKAKAGYIKKVQLKLWMRMMRFPRRSCRGIGLTSFGISDAESRVVLASYVKDSGEDDPVVQIAYGQGDDRKVYHIHVNDVDISNASDMEMFALLSYEGYKGRTAPGAINNYSAYKTFESRRRI